MLTSLKTATLFVGCSLLFAQSDAQAGALLEQSFSANASNHCHAFDSGQSGFRTRVVGVENIGAPVAVVCAFQSHNSLLSLNPKRLVLRFSNTTSGTFNITCTLLSSALDSPTAFAVTKTVTLLPMSHSEQSIEFNAADNPTPSSLTLGSRLLGVNCTLPTGAQINETRLYWDELI